MNPILLKEMRILLRERRGWLVPMIYAAVLASAVALLLVPQSLADDALGNPRSLGQILVGIVAGFQVVVVAIFAPLLGAAAIAGEREQSTWLSLLASPVARAQVVLGKLVASVLYMMLILCVSAPIAALGLLMGSIDLPTLLGLYLAHALLAIAGVSLGLAVSCLFRRTWAAGLVAIGALLALTLISGLATTTLYAFFQAAGLHGLDEVALWPLYLNPFWGTVVFLAGDVGDTVQPAAWWTHFAALGTFSVLAVGFSAGRMLRMRG